VGISAINVFQLDCLAVYSVDNYSGARDLVTALIDDTISSTSNHSELLRNRPKDLTVTIEYVFSVPLFLSNTQLGTAILPN
jgi:hypothetical protein